MALASAHRKLLIYISYLYWEFNWEPNWAAPQALLFKFPHVIQMIYIIYVWYNLLPSLSHLVTNRNHVWLVFNRLWHVTLWELTVVNDWETKCTSVNFLLNEGFYYGPLTLTLILCYKSNGIHSFKWKYLSNKNLQSHCRGYIGSSWSSCSWSTLCICGISKFLSIFTHFIMYLQWNKIVFDIVVFLQILCCPLKFTAYLTFMCNDNIKR